MHKRTNIRVLSLLIVLSMMLSAVPASAVTAQQEQTGTGAMYFACTRKSKAN